MKLSMRLIDLIKLFVALIFASCNNISSRSHSNSFAKDSTDIVNLIHIGDSIYSTKANYSTFSKSLELYDSAWQRAMKTTDTGLISLTIFAKGRAYDALNNNPQTTIRLYSRAANLYSSLPNKHSEALYIKHLVAHSYDKVKDSANCINVLQELYTEIAPKSDSEKMFLNFIPEMALISTEVKNYTLADSILNYLTRRSWIKNESTSYDYLYHYYLSKARIEIFGYKNLHSPYLDSLEYVYNHIEKISEKLFYCNYLIDLYRYIQNESKESYYLRQLNRLNAEFNSPEYLRVAKEKITTLEISEKELERKLEYEKAKTREKYIYFLFGLLSIVSVFSFFIYKKNLKIKMQKNDVDNMNKQLIQKNIQNELLSKEIQHRVKNNLQMISSLVYMQEHNSTSPEVKENMQAIRMRIESIANLHHQLLKQTDIVNVQRYIQDLVNNAVNIIDNTKKVITHLDIDAIDVPHKISFPLGLIINEWITNTIKYALTNEEYVKIMITICGEDDILKVTYKDNGHPKSIAQKKNSLGLEIVNILADQLDATLITESNNIFHYLLIIPLNVQP
jgi:two-component sensor histidine kinase